MSDPNVPPLSDNLRALVKRAADADIPAAPGPSRERVLAGVVARIGPPPGGGGDGGPSSGSSGARAAPVRSATGLVRRVLPLAASFLLGGATVALVLRSPTLAPATLRVAAVEPAPAPAAIPPAPPGVEATVPVEDLPIKTSPPALRKPPPLGPSPVAAQSGLAEERALLDVARKAVEREDGAAALAAILQHEHKYPSGILVQEREAMAVRALLILGRPSAARARADRVRVRFPDSVLLPTVEAAVNAASTP